MFCVLFFFFWSVETGVVSVIPNEALKLHTTHSWEFLGLEKNGRIVDWSIWKEARFGEDTIIATLDTGNVFSL